MPPVTSGRVFTLNDLQEGNVPLQNTHAQLTTSLPLRIAHIPTLPAADYAQQLLQRVVHEFEPIMKQKGYPIASVSEMCCCWDGLDFDADGKRSKSRKRRAVGKNIWGYNQWTTRNGYDKTHTIHLRLRHANNHSRFLMYEDIAGTMAHELAHCEHGPHNADFYKLMDAILEQHAVFMASKLTLQGTHIPSFHGAGQKLGGRDCDATVTRTASQGYKLGGDNAFQQWMTPKEAAVAAAEMRRRQQELRMRGDRCCRPCIIEINDSDDEELYTETDSSDRTDSEKKGNEKFARVIDLVDSEISENQKKKVKVSSCNTSKEVVCIDLTSDELPLECVVIESSKKTNSVTAAARWACTFCTYINAPLAQTCDVCRNKR
jgi:DNA-dependent metalloprotease WSS1